VHSLRRASAKELKLRAIAALQQFAAYGTTTIEAKSGYGLDWKSESKILNILYELHQEQPIDIAATFLGAHTVPVEYKGRADAYVSLLTKKCIPNVAMSGLAEFCDVFCDRGSFTVSQAQDSDGWTRLRPGPPSPRRATCTHGRSATGA
jgi:imidazolonepropionase